MAAYILSATSIVLAREQEPRQMRTSFTNATRAGFAAVALLSMAPAIAHAQTPPPPPGAGQMPPPPPPGAHMGWHHEGMDKHIDRILQRLGATADQKAKIHGIADAAKKDLEPLHAQLRDAHKQMHALLGAAQVDAAAIEALRVKEQGVHDQISRRISAALIDAANVLTPEQRAKFAAMPHPMGPPGPRGPGGPGGQRPPQ